MGWSVPYERGLKPFLTIIVITFGILITNVVSDFAGGLKTEIAKLFDSPSDKQFKNLFRLDDKKIEEMITTSLAMKEEDLQELEKEYTLPLIENHLTEMKDYPPVVFFKSPEYEIKREVYWTIRTTGYPFMSYDWNRDLQDVFPILQGDKLHIEIKWWIPGGKINSNGHIEARQGDNIFVFWPSFPASYDKEVGENGVEYDTEKHNVSFPADPKLVDYTLPLKVVVQYSGEDDFAVYELDFKNFIQ